jgi:hypothetical protein
MSVLLAPMRNLLAAVLLLGLACNTDAQEPVVESAPESAPVADPPSRVARLSLTEGEVSITPAGTDEWALAVLNRPLTSGDRIWVDGDGRAEVQVGSATIHLRGGTGFSFVDLDDESLRMSVTDGAITVRVHRKLEREAIEISTPNAVVALLHPGEYHIEINEAGDQTTVKTRNGDAEIRGEGGTHVVRTNEQGVFTGKDRLTAHIGPITGRTEFERWANERNQRDESSESSRYVSEDVVGHEDLDSNGSWVSEPEYGYVWRPTYVAANWAPYRYGRWVWVSPWGWNWVDAAPWGFAPFHYGRWAYVRSSWCWVPGPRYVRPVYAPALVGWYGGPHVSVSLSFGTAVGWFPLAPHEVYWPGYHYSHRYVRNVNYSNTVIVTNNYFDNHYRGDDHYDYRHRRYPHAVTMVNRDTFVGGRAIGDRYLHVSQQDLSRWRGDWRPPGIAPERDSVFGGEMRGNRPFDRLNHPNRQVTTDRMPHWRVPFEDERRAITANNGRPIDRSALFDPPKQRGDFRVISARRDGDKQPQRVTTYASTRNSDAWTPRPGQGGGSGGDGSGRGDRDGDRHGFTNNGGGQRPSTNQRQPSELGMRSPQSRGGGDAHGDFRGNGRGSTRSVQPPSEPRIHAFRGAEPGSSPTTAYTGQQDWRSRQQPYQPSLHNSQSDHSRHARSPYQQDRGRDRYGGGNDWGTRQHQQPPSYGPGTQDRGRDRNNGGSNWGARQYQPPQPSPGFSHRDRGGDRHSGGYDGNPRQYQQPPSSHGSGESRGGRSTSEGHSSSRSRGDSGGSRGDWGGGRSGGRRQQ